MFYTYIQKCPPHLINVITLPSENENITFHTFIMHSLNITRCIFQSYDHKCSATFFMVHSVVIGNASSRWCIYAVHCVCSH